MSANDSRRTGILRLRHLREVTEARGEEMEGQRERFARLADQKTAPRIVSAYQLFQTPPELAARLAGMLADGRHLGRTLEPSAGLGRLYKAVRAVDATCTVVLVDSSPECCGELYRATDGDGAARLVAGDFLTTTAERLGGLFDSVIMNPPFHGAGKTGDIAHVLHALQMLAPGGRLVSVVMDGPRQRKALKAVASEWHDLPAGSFRSEGTNVGAAVVVFQK